MLVNYDMLKNLPRAEDLPDSDDTPVDNQLQHLIPALLEAILALIWSARMDWFFGVNMGVYYDPDQNAIVPDGFLSVGVPRISGKNLRLSYLLWAEKKVPIFVLEVVSQTARKEYTAKKDFYQKMGILYYIVYNPLRKRKPRLEAFQLENGIYKSLDGEPIWLPEIGLGIGKEQGIYQGIEREWLYWYDSQGKRYLTPEEQLENAQQQALIAQQQALIAQERTEKLEEILRNLGINPQEI